MVDSLRPGDPAHIGPYRLDGRLGAGGMGQVYLGTSPSGRQVAVKLIRRELASSAQFRARFAQEVEAARSVGGFHTAQVVDADPAAEAPWLVTAYVPGPTLQQVITGQGPLAPDAVLRLGAGLAEGLAAIHRCGLVHRDLKPGNVIMAADGPRIIDFGVAHAVGAAEPMTRAGAVIGTYAYMSPEQIRAEPVAPASDIFSLGSVLAFAATGRSPFEASVVPAIVHRVTQEAPQLPGMSGALYELTVACLDKNPYARPSADDILARLSVTAPGVPSPPSPAPKALPRRALIFGGAAVAAAAVGVPAYVLWPESKSGSGSGSGSKGGTGSPKSPPARDFSKPVVRLSGHTSNVGCLAFGPDGKTLASGAFDGSVRLWDAVGGRAITTFKGHKEWAMAVAFSPDGATLYSGSFDKTLRRWDVRTGVPKGVLASYAGEFDSVNCLASSPDGKSLAAGVGSTVRLLDPSTGRTRATLNGHTGSMRGVAFSPDGRTLASVAADTEEGIVRYWDAGTGRLIRTFTAGGSKNYSTVAFSPDGKTLAGFGPGVRMWDLASGHLKSSLTDGRHDYLSTGAYGPVGALIAGAGGNRTLKPEDTTGRTISLWDASTGRLSTATLNAVMPTSKLTASLDSLVFSPDGTTLAAAVNLAAVTQETDTSIQLWKLPGRLPTAPPTDGTHG
ncbi:serine/threonine-protein kinase [Streptomyces sp. NPDC050738]|uniref:WD40 repeat domain-containing serine/threonine protein kinase n=1 Tax=Streptomyces sp. NPDC050738 TaxID=3154744 RepID=UPI00341C4EB9